MMQKFFKDPQPLRRVQHAQLRVQPAPTAAFAAELTAVPVVIEEMTEASSVYPVMFAPSGNVVPVAVLGLAQRNVFLDADYQWSVNYVPAFIRRYPFSLANGAADSDEMLIAVDMAAPQLSNEHGERLFQDDGDASEALHRIGAFLRQYDNSLNRTIDMLRVLSERDVLVQRDLTASQGDERVVFASYRVVDLERLKALSDAELAGWARDGILPVVYAHLASLRHLDRVFAAATAH